MGKKDIVLLFILIFVVPPIWIFTYNYFIDQRFILVENSINSNLERIQTLENQKLECEVLEVKENEKGSNTCKNKGYDMCLQTYCFTTEEYYASTDTTCIGIQDRETRVTVWGCDKPAQIFYGYGTCSYYDAGGVNGKEPIQGDTRTLMSYKVVCCNKAQIT